MPKYAVKLARTASTTLAVGVIQSTATTPGRIKVYDLIVGSEASPADNVFLYTLDKVTAQGSLAGGTAVTPQKLDEADRAALADALDTNITTNPTIGGRLLTIPLNQRATMRWVAPPGGELVSPATDNTGFALQTPTASGLVAVSSTIHIIE